MKYIGYISGTRETDGTMVVSDTPKGIKEIVSEKIYIGFSESFAKEYIIEKFDFKKMRAYLKVERIKTREEAREFKDMGVYTEADNITFNKKNQYLVNDIMECTVFDVETNNKLGEIIDVWYLPANDVWVIDHEKGEVPIPVIEDVIVEVDIHKKTVKINMLEGLLELTNEEGREEENDDKGPEDE